MGLARDEAASDERMDASFPSESPRPSGSDRAEFGSLGSSPLSAVTALFSRLDGDADGMSSTDWVSAATLASIAHPGSDHSSPRSVLATAALEGSETTPCLATCLRDKFSPPLRTRVAAATVPDTRTPTNLPAGASSPSASTSPALQHLTSSSPVSAATAVSPSAEAGSVPLVAKTFSIAFLFQASCTSPSDPTVRAMAPLDNVTADASPTARTPTPRGSFVSKDDSPK